jgi:hypothetical protein
MPSRKVIFKGSCALQDVYPSDAQLMAANCLSSAVGMENGLLSVKIRWEVTKCGEDRGRCPVGINHLLEQGPP